MTNTGFVITIVCQYTYVLGNVSTLLILCPYCTHFTLFQSVRAAYIHWYELSVKYMLSWSSHVKPFRLIKCTVVCY